jgi:AraC-like DNA-binding protein
VDYEELTPPPELGALVHRMWTLTGRATADGPFQRAMPDGRAELIFNLADPFECLDGAVGLRQPLALLVGPSRRAMAIRPTGRVDLVGIRFRPEALAAWLRIGGDEVTGRAFALADLPAPLDRTLPEQLAAARGSRDRMALLGRHLSRTMHRTDDPRLATAVDMALAGPHAGAEAVARSVGLSRRQLARLFRQRIGLGPRSLVRLGRFQRVLRSLEGDPRGSLAVLADRTGYFDQAHMNRDFRIFAGTTPRGYLREVRELTRHFLAEPA